MCVCRSDRGLANQDLQSCAVNGDGGPTGRRQSTRRRRRTRTRRLARPDRSGPAGAVVRAQSRAGGRADSAPGSLARMVPVGGRVIREEEPLFSSEVGEPDLGLVGENRVRLCKTPATQVRDGAPFLQRSRGPSRFRAHAASYGPFPRSSAALQSAMSSLPARQLPIVARRCLSTRACANSRDTAGAREEICARARSGSSRPCDKEIQICLQLLRVRG